MIHQKLISLLCVSILFPGTQLCTISPDQIPHKSMRALASFYADQFPTESYGTLQKLFEQLSAKNDVNKQSKEFKTISSFISSIESKEHGFASDLETIFNDQSKPKDQKKDEIALLMNLHISRMQTLLNTVEKKINTTDKSLSSVAHAINECVSDAKKNLTTNMRPKIFERKKK